MLHPDISPVPSYMPYDNSVRMCWQGITMLLWRNKRIFLIIFLLIPFLPYSVLQSTNIIALNLIQWYSSSIVKFCKVYSLVYYLALCHYCFQVFLISWGCCCVVLILAILLWGLMHQYVQFLSCIAVTSVLLANSLLPPMQAVVWNLCEVELFILAQRFIPGCHLIISSLNANVDVWLFWKPLVSVRGNLASLGEIQIERRRRIPTLKNQNFVVWTSSPAKGREQSLLIGSRSAELT